MIAANRTHETPVTVNGFTTEVDEGIAPLIAELWRAGINTWKSRHWHTPSGKVWVMFASGEDCRRFLNAIVSVEPNAWARAAAWSFGQHDTGAAVRGAMRVHPAGWDFNLSVEDDALLDGGAPNFVLPVAVLFPRGDLLEVTRRLRLWNDRSG